MTKAKRNIYMARYRARHRKQIREYDRQLRIRKGGRVRTPTIVCQVCRNESPNNINGTKKFCSKSCFRKAFRPHKNEWSRAWYKLNRERLLLWQRTYYANTRGKYQRGYYEKNRKRHLARAKLWRKNNVAKQQSVSRSYYLLNQGSIRDQAKLWRNNHIELIHDRIASLDGIYVRGLLQKHSFLRKRDFPPEIVELKRKQIRLLRAIKQRKVNTCTLNTSAA